MKKETKALIEWIKAQIGVAAKLDDSYLITTNAISTHKNLEKDAVKFLDSLPEIESHLCRGGYIQDRNGTSCCNGELVYFLSKSQKEKYGYLIWDKKMARFVIEVVDERDCKYIVPELEWFEKVQFEKVSELEKVEE